MDFIPAFSVWNLLFLLPPLAKSFYDTFHSEASLFREVRHQSTAFAITTGLTLAIFDWQLSPVKFYFQSLFLAFTTYWVCFRYFKNMFQLRFSFRFNTLFWLKFLIFFFSLLCYYAPG